MNRNQNHSHQKEYAILLQKRDELTQKQLADCRQSENASTRSQQTLRYQELQHQAEKIQRALERLAAGCYGICLICRNPIEERRLWMIPETELCHTCRQKQEMQKSVLRKSLQGNDD